ncbi:MAG: KOW domain-containing RNA-binding protein [Oscillospiraceae bacterium]|nr:KOW domain-containing RNA-binding protein [Oscillospiraceae bacterium]
MWPIGTIVESIAGRDKDYLLCVVGYEGGMVLVADGRERPLQRPKKKNPNHLAPLLQLEPLTWELRGNNALRKALNRISER